MKKLVILVSLLLTIAVASAATVTLDKAIYEAGETISVTVSGCPDGTSATAHIGTLWADQGTISGGSWSTQYQIPTAFPSTGSSQNLDAYCDGTARANFCVSPGCSTGSSEESSGESSGSSGGGGAGGAGGAPSASSGGAPSAASGGGSYGGSSESIIDEAPAEDTPLEEPAIQQESEGMGTLGISLIVILVALLIAGGYFLMRRSKTKSN